jgi:glutathione S-transferase
MSEPELYVANRNYSSWSLRAWLALRWSGLAFTERLIDLDQLGYGEPSVARIVLSNHPPWRRLPQRAA